jgi:hypothetical protein
MDPQDRPLVKPLIERARSWRAALTNWRAKRRKCRQMQEAGSPRSFLERTM